MKKFGVCLVLILVLGTACFAQSTNDAQRIVGTWFNVDTQPGKSITFNSNGTFSGYLGDGRYFISNGKLFLDREIIYNYYFSSDGRILFIEGTGGSNIRLWYDKR